MKQRLCVERERHVFAQREEFFGDLAEVFHGYVHSLLFVNRLQAEMAHDASKIALVNDIHLEVKGTYPQMASDLSGADHLDAGFVARHFASKWLRWDAISPEVGSRSKYLE